MAAGVTFARLAAAMSSLTALRFLFAIFGGGVLRNYLVACEHLVVGHIVRRNGRFEFDGGEDEVRSTASLLPRQGQCCERDARATGVCTETEKVQLLSSFASSVAKVPMSGKECQ